MCNNYTSRIREKSNSITLSQTTNFRLFQPERTAQDNFKFIENIGKLSKWIENFRLFQPERTAQDNFKFIENIGKLSKWIENSVGKGEIARYEQFLLFPRCFQK